MIYKGVLITEASGRIDGAVASRNRGTEYFRSIGPAPTSFTTEQAQVQAAVAAANTAWQSGSSSWRDGWTRFAAERHHPDRIGRRFPRTGWNEFLRWAVPRLQANTVFSLTLPINGPAPTMAEQPQDPKLLLSFRSDTTAFVDFEDRADWTLDPDSALLVYVSSPISPTRNRAYGGYNITAAIVGDPGSPPPSHLGINLPAGWSSGERLFWRARFTTSDHASSTPQYGRVVYP